MIPRSTNFISTLDPSHTNEICGDADMLRRICCDAYMRDKEEEKSDWCRQDDVSLTLITRYLVNWKFGRLVWLAHTHGDKFVFDPKCHCSVANEDLCLALIHVKRWMWMALAVCRCCLRCAGDTSSPHKFDKQKKTEKKTFLHDLRKL